MSKPRFRIKFQDPEILYLNMWLASHVSLGPAMITPSLRISVASTTKTIETPWFRMGCPVFTDLWSYVLTCACVLFIFCYVDNLVARLSRLIDKWMEYLLITSRITPQFLPISRILGVDSYDLGLYNMIVSTYTVLGERIQMLQTMVIHGELGVERVKPVPESHGFFLWLTLASCGNDSRGSLDIPLSYSFP